MPSNLLTSSGFDSFWPASYHSWDYKGFVTSYVTVPVYVFGYIIYKREYCNGR